MGMRENVKRRTQTDDTVMVIQKTKVLKTTGEQSDDIGLETR